MLNKKFPSILRHHLGMQPQPWPPEKHKNAQQAQQKGEKVEVPVGLKRLHRLRSYQNFQFLQVLDSKYNCKLGQGIVLLFACNPIVAGSLLIVYSSSPTIVEVISQSNPSCRVTLSSSPRPIDKSSLPHRLCIVQFGFFPVKNIGSITLGDFIAKLCQQQVLQKSLIIPSPAIIRMCFHHQLSPFPPFCHILVQFHSSWARP